jgi:hypothetical protein
MRWAEQSAIRSILQFLRTLSPVPSYKFAVSAVFQKYCWTRSVIVQYDGFAFSATASAWREALESQTLEAAQCPGSTGTRTQVLQLTGGVANFIEAGGTVLLQRVLETRFRVVIVLAPANLLVSLAVQANGILATPFLLHYC